MVLNWHHSRLDLYWIQSGFNLTPEFLQCDIKCLYYPEAQDGLILSNTRVPLSRTLFPKFHLKIANAHVPFDICNTEEQQHARKLPILSLLSFSRACHGLMSIMHKKEGLESSYSIIMMVGDTYVVFLSAYEMIMWIRRRPHSSKERLTLIQLLWQIGAPLMLFLVCKPWNTNFNIL